MKQQDETKSGRDNHLLNLFTQDTLHECEDVLRFRLPLLLLLW